MVEKTFKFSNAASRKSSGGFTLLEVLVVVAILGILGAIGVTSMREKVVREEVRGQVMTLRSYLDETSARARAKDTSLSLRVVGDSLYAYEGNACGNAVKGKFGLQANVHFISAGISALPTDLSSTTNNWAASSFCIAFEPRIRIGLNPLSSTGYIAMQSARLPRIQGIVGKSATVNKPLQFMSIDEGVTWTAQ